MGKDRESKGNYEIDSPRYSLEEILESLQEAERKIEVFVTEHGHFSQPTPQSTDIAEKDRS